MLTEVEDLIAIAVGGEVPAVEAAEHPTDQRPKQTRRRALPTTQNAVPVEDEAARFTFQASIQKRAVERENDADFRGQPRAIV